MSGGKEARDSQPTTHDCCSKMSFSAAHKQLLLRIAKDSIRHGLDHGRPLVVALEGQPPELLTIRATFVTLRRDGELRGCIGVLEAHQALIVDVAHNAYAAAFADPRFTPVTRTELENLEYHISILSVPTPLSFTSEEDLLGKILPGVDGLILKDGRRRGTFLPSVWETIPTPREFLRELKRKAGLPMDHWSDTLSVKRYTCESVGDETVER